MIVDPIARRIAANLLKVSAGVDPLSHGAAADGSTDDSAAVSAAATAAANANLPLVFSKGIYRFKQVNIPSNSVVVGAGGVCSPVSGNCAAGNGLFQCSSVQNVEFVNVNIKQHLASDRCVGILIDNCSNVRVKGGYGECSNLQLIAIRNSQFVTISGMEISLGKGGNYGVGVRILGSSSSIKVNNCHIHGYKVTQKQKGSGHQPTGDLWGSVGINTDITDQFTSSADKWAYRTGTYTIPSNSPPSSVIIPVTGVSAAGWEIAAAIGITPSGGQGQQEIFAIAGADQITLSNIPGSSAGEVITWWALSYAHAPQYCYFNDNTIEGMIYAGISCITGRDLHCNGGSMISIGDIGWDVEGCQRTTINGATFYDIGDMAAITSGYRDSITNCTIAECTIGARIVEPSIAYQTLPANTVLPLGLRGQNDVSGNRITVTPISGTPITVDRNVGFASICNNSLDGYYNAIMTNGGFSIDIVNNRAKGQISASGINGASISGNVISDAPQNNFILLNCSNFSIVGNVVRNTSQGVGGGNGVKATRCSNGIIGPNTFVNVKGVEYLDGGGNTGLVLVENQAVVPPGPLASLPTPSAANLGLAGWVTDSTVALSSKSLGATIVGGGPFGVPARSTGRVWIIA